jgi:hypothetical protein
MKHLQQKSACLDLEVNNKWKKMYKYKQQPNSISTKNE